MLNFTTETTKFYTEQHKDNAVKINRKRARYFNAAANERIGSAMYVHLTGSGSQSLRCLLPIFDPDGAGQNPLDFSPFRGARFKDECGYHGEGLPKAFL